ncbi:hypothetical protein [Longispora albida]|uniref:hypothetical protein n=1 Tax=Longispora albida TaxID=203523 RepID=UPI00036A38AC|nr:hypothetical protein [Longispora albida]
MKADGEVPPTSKNTSHESGKGARWYDPPYRALHALRWSRLGRRLPESLKGKLTYALHFLNQFTEHQRHLAQNRDDLFGDIGVPADEHVRVPGLWMAELFPPSEFARLKAMMGTSSWDRFRVQYLRLQSNRELLESARAGGGWRWWPVAEIVNENSTITHTDGQRTTLPDEFAMISLVAVQVDVGLTAMLAHVQLTDTASRKLDEVWHSAHEPRLVRVDGQTIAEDRMWSGFRTTQQARRRVHDLARHWMARTCPGAFASLGQAQPLMDLLLTDRFDPTDASTPVPHPDRNAFRALGLTRYETFPGTCPELPGLVLEQVEVGLCPAMNGERTWSLWGNTASVVTQAGSLSAYGQDSAQAIASLAGKRTRNFFVQLAITELLELMERRYAAIRDQARVRHGKFKGKDIRRLREDLLTLSIDLSSIARDVQAFNARTWRDEGDCQFTLDESAAQARRTAEHGHKPFEAVDWNMDMAKRQGQHLDRLQTADRDYREILSTTVSLGASLDAYRVGRVAIWIAVASLAVSAAALLTVSPDSDAPLARIFRWLGSLW